MAEVKVLFEGVHELIEGGENVGSMSVLIRSEKNILVDTGSFQDKQKLIDSLQKEGLTPEDIDIIVLTHLHIDHLANINIFPDSSIYVKHNTSTPGLRWKTSSYFIESVVVDNLDIDKDVKLIETPGHFPCQISVVVKTEKGIVVIAGDAIRDKGYMDMSKNPGSCHNLEEFNKSREKILKIADYIIFGHGGIVKVKK